MEPDINLEKPNAVGTLDRLITNSALAVIAVFPTFATAMIMPWKLASLLEDDHQEGRKGFLLSPGAYFPLSLLVTLLIASVFTSPEIVRTDGSFIGPRLAVTVSTAAAEGEIWKVIGAVLPIYIFTIGLGLIGRCFSFLLGEAWTIRVSLRAAFYVIATGTSWIILSTAAIGIVRIAYPDPALRDMLFASTAFIILGIWLWMYFWLIRSSCQTSYLRAGIVPVLILGGAIAMSIAIGASQAS